MAERSIDARRAKEPNVPVAVAMCVVLAHLFNFGVVSCALLYDLVRKLVDAFGPADIEVLLALLRQAGPQMRRSMGRSVPDSANFPGAADFPLFSPAPNAETEIRRFPAPSGKRPGRRADRLRRFFCPKGNDRKWTKRTTPQTPRQKNRSAC